MKPLKDLGRSKEDTVGYLVVCPRKQSPVAGVGVEALGTIGERRFLGRVMSEALPESKNAVMFPRKESTPPSGMVKTGGIPEPGGLAGSPVKPELPTHGVVYFDIVGPNVGVEVGWTFGDSFIHAGDSARLRTMPGYSRSGEDWVSCMLRSELKRKGKQTDRRIRGERAISCASNMTSSSEGIGKDSWRRRTDTE